MEGSEGKVFWVSVPRSVAHLLQQFSLASFKKTAKINPEIKIKPLLLFILILKKKFIIPYYWSVFNFSLLFSIHNTTSNTNTKPSSS